MTARILCIGQSDSLASTGVQADVKTAQAFGGYAATAVTAVCAQNRTGIHDIEILPARMVVAQIEAILTDFTPQVVKTGLLACAETIEAVAGIIASLKERHGTPVIVDPILSNRMGRALLNKEARDAMKRDMLLQADVLLPNITEAQDLTGMRITDPDALRHAAEMLMTLGPRTVVLKGGAMPLDDETVADAVADDRGVEIYSHPRLRGKGRLGAGTTLAAGVAICLAEGRDLRASYMRARAYLQRSMESSDGTVSGRGPLNHAVMPPEKEFTYVQ